jgi:hypothetical protein
MRGFRGMIHFSERARTLVWEASEEATNSRASTAEALPPMMATFLPFALLPSSWELCQISPLKFSWPGSVGLRKGVYS